jgi:hypothetical protein
MTFYGSLVVVHVIGAFLFVLFHGASAAVVLSIRRESDVARIRTLLDLSKSTLGLFYIGLVVMLVGGIWAGIEGGWFSRGALWLWVAIGVLVIVAFAMYALISRHFMAWRKLIEAEPLIDGAILRAQMQTSQPLLGAAAGLVGLIVIVWLMVAKPF